MNKPNPFLAKLFEIPAIMTLERWKETLVEKEARFFEIFDRAYPEESIVLPEDGGPVRQEKIIKYRDYVGWVPFMEEVRQSVVMMRPFIRMVGDSKKSLKIMKSNYSGTFLRPPPPADFWKTVEQRTRQNGVGDIGYTTVDPSLVFAGMGMLFSNIIVLIMETDYDAIAQSPGFPGGAETMRVYAKLTRATNDLALYLQKSGYHAQPVIPYGGQVLYPLLAANAGLGYPGYHGLLINERFGPALRISAVATDAPSFPETRPNRMAAIREFCETCRKCINSCPGNAIYPTPISREDSPVVTHMDNKKCYPYVARYKHCSVCIRVCAKILKDKNLIGA
ncbi:MAG: hypothetical protein SWH61_16365 [Thermodesulfobacteriota bacterium]|nr:hypothetical protein [Thermodesulfobacteriota bacterium]